MIVKHEQIPDCLSSQCAPVYLVHGDEPLLVMETSDAIRTFYHDSGYSEREVYNVDATFEWDLLRVASNTLSLFSEKRLIELRMPTGKPGKPGAQALGEYIERPPEDVVLLITCGKIEKNAQKSKWFSNIDKAGVTVQCWPVRASEIAPWIEKRFAARNMRASGETCSMIGELVEGNLMAAAQEVEKLHLLCGEGELDLQTARDAVADSSRFNVFDLGDAMLSGDRVRTIRVLHGLRAEGEQPLGVLWMVAKELRILLQVSTSSYSVDAALSQAGVWKSRTALYRKVLQRHTSKRFAILLKRCSQLDRLAKGLDTGNPWDKLGQIATTLAGAA